MKEHRKLQLWELWIRVASRKTKKKMNSDVFMVKLSWHMDTETDKSIRLSEKVLLIFEFFICNFISFVSIICFYSRPRTHNYMV